MKTPEECLKEQNIYPEKLDSIINYAGRARLLKAMKSYGKEVKIQMIKDILNEEIEIDISLAADYDIFQLSSNNRWITGDEF